jgi:hypothetical protein
MTFDPSRINVLKRMVDIQREMVAANVEVGELLSRLLQGGVDREAVLERINRAQAKLAERAAEFEALAENYREHGDPET